ncbi:MAG: protein kinase domain-containing protein, partial [Kiritimatiellia bacterium]
MADRYELEAEFGRGGFATVWRARDRKLGRIVALKRLLPEALAGEGGRQTLERFRREAQAVASLNHRNIVAVYDRGEDVAGPYVVMELVEDGNLRSLLKERGKLDLSETLRIARGVALGLDHAHRKNLVHRDIKPANILLRREGDELIPKIADFGLARIGADSGVSLSGYGMGTMAYMPPEQRRDAKNVNHTADIYALGKTLYEMLTGVTPDDVDLEKLPPTYAAIIRRCVRPNPDERYFSVESLLADLDRAASASALAKVDTSAASSTKNPCPACTQENTEDAEFCEGCGTGLMRDCPECGTRNRTVKLFCRKCGTAVESFVKVSESVDRARRYLEDHQFSRVIKETDSLTELSPGLKGPKGRQLLKDAEKLHEQATKLSATRDKKIKDVRQAYEERHGAKLRAAFESLKPLMPKLDADLTSISEEMETIDKENQIAALCSRARAAHQQREANGLAVALNELKFLCPDLPGEMSALAADVENIRYEQSAAPFRKAVEKALADEQPEVAEQVIAKWRTLGREDPEIDQVAVRLHACRRMLLERQVAASLSNVRSALTNDAPDQAEHALADWPAAAAADPRLVAVQSEIEQLRHVLICAADAAALFDEHRYQECIEICHKLLNCGGAARVIKGHQWEGSVTEIIWRATRHVKQAEDLKVEALRARETRDWTTALALSTKLAALAPHDPDAPIIKVEAERRLFADRCCATAQQELRAGNLEAVDQALSAWRRLGLTDDTRLPDIDKMLTAARASAA